MRQFKPFQVETHSNSLPTRLDRRLSVAPMMERTDRHFRYFLRLMTRHVLLYTEMITTGALLHGKSVRLLAHDASEHPVGLQLGGSDPAELAECARMGYESKYDEINLNIGCPSNRVQSGRFGACLMADPELVANCVTAMTEAVPIPITVKTRLGIDDRDSYVDLSQFIDCIAAVGCETFILHARKAWLHGLSPKENRNIPPLRYDVVHKIKRDYPNLEIILNGSVKSLEQVTDQLTEVDGVMIGRAAYDNPYLLASADQRIYNNHTAPLRRFEVLERFRPYVERQLAEGVGFSVVTRPILGLFQGQPGAKLWRRTLSEHGHRGGANIKVLELAAAQITAPSNHDVARHAGPNKARQQTLSSGASRLPYQTNGL